MYKWDTYIIHDKMYVFSTIGIVRMVLHFNSEILQYSSIHTVMYSVQRPEFRQRGEISDLNQGLLVVLCSYNQLHNRHQF